MTTSDFRKALACFRLHDEAAQRRLVGQLAYEREALTLALTMLVRERDLMAMVLSHLDGDRRTAHRTAQGWLDHLAERGLIIPIQTGD